MGDMFNDFLLIWNPLISFFLLLIVVMMVVAKVAIGELSVWEGGGGQRSCWSP